MLIGFNTGVYETIDLSQWIAGNPLDVLATNSAKPPSLFEKFPHRDVFITDKEGQEDLGSKVAYVTRVLGQRKRQKYLAPEDFS
ncbi:MAG: hypothetical protein ACREHD_27600 [Pirellulales bacterium]